VNFYALVPASISANPISPAVSAQYGGVMISFPTQMGFNYQAEYKNNLTDANWIPLGTLIPGNNAVQTVSEASGSDKFSRVEVLLNPAY
jgi:hypothetical protein